MSRPEGRQLYNRYALADRLRMPVSELLKLPAAEIDGWYAYLKEAAKHANA